MSSRPVVEVKGLEKSFGSLPVLKGLDLTVESGQVYGFLGRNGAGKSTTLRILVGILQIGGGTVQLFGEPMRTSNTALRQKIGYVAQEQNFYGWMTPLSLGEFVQGFYPNWDQAHYLRLLESLELPPRRKVQTFSGGMKAKQGLALALAHSPPLLVLDEPTAGLDPVARREFLQIVREQSRERGATVLFSSHLIDEVERAADRVGLMDHGVMFYEGPLELLSAQVREVVGPLEAVDFGTSVEVLKSFPERAVLRSHDPENWGRLGEQFPELTFRVMGLEDIFVELVTQRKGLHGHSSSSAS